METSFGRNVIRQSSSIFLEVLVAVVFCPLSSSIMGQILHHLSLGGKEPRTKL